MKNKRSAEATIYTFLNLIITTQSNFFKKSLFLILALFTITTAKAQDTLILKSQDTLLVYIESVSKEEVRYKKQLDGENSYLLPADRVQVITYGKKQAVVDIPVDTSGTEQKKEKKPVEKGEEKNEVWASIGGVDIIFSLEYERRFKVSDEFRLFGRISLGGGITGGILLGELEQWEAGLFYKSGIIFNNINSGLGVQTGYRVQSGLLSYRFGVQYSTPDVVIDSYLFKLMTPDGFWFYMGIGASF